MVDEFDNRHRLPAPRIDFDDDVGTTGQDHDTHPEPGQARYDWMRMAIIALLSHQSADDFPTQFRTGTTQYRRDLLHYLYRKELSGGDENWRPIAEAIALETDETDGALSLSLQGWFDSVQPLLESLRPKFTWSGSSNSNNITAIPVPDPIEAELTAIVDDIRPLVWIDGLLVDPRNTRFSEAPVVVELLSGVELNRGQRFTVITEKFSEFVVDEIVA